MIPIAVSGACGRMAGQVLRRALEDKEITVVAAIDAPDNPKIGMDVGEVLGVGHIGIQLAGANALGEELQRSNPRFLVEFTNPEATVRNAETAAANKVGLVIGTTGLSEVQTARIKEVIRENGVVGLISPNFSICVNLLFKMAAEAAKTLKGYDIEVVEAHHRFKKDAPSGTAKKLAGAIADAVGRNLDDVAVYGRRGMTGERKAGEIGIHSVRAGDIVGDHTIIFATLGERIEIKHQAHSRDAFAYGCLRTIKWLAKQKPGIYEMKDVLGL